MSREIAPQDDHHHVDVDPLYSTDPAPALTLLDKVTIDVARLEGKLEVYGAHREGPETPDSDRAWCDIWGMLGRLKRDLGIDP